MSQQLDRTQTDVQLDVEFEIAEKTMSSTFGEDWDDSNEPLEPIVNKHRIDPELLYDGKREPRENNCKRKLCYSRQFDDGYGCSRRLVRIYRNSRRHLRGRGKRFKKTDSDLEMDSLDEHQTGSSLGLSDGEQLGYTSAEDTHTEHEMDQDTNDLMKKIETGLKFTDKKI